MSNRTRWIGTVILLLVWVYTQGGASVIVPSVAPIPEPGLHVLIVTESADPTPQLAAMLNASAWQGLVPNGNWRVYDPDSDMSRDLEKWRNAMQRERGSLPWLIVSNHPDGGYEGPLPATLAELVSTIKRVGGLP